MQSSPSSPAAAGSLAIRQTKLLSWSPSEEHLFAHIHSQCGNRWAQIAKRLPGRSPNDVWHSTLRAKVCRRNSFLYTYLRHLADNWDNPAARAAAYDQAMRDMNDGALEPPRLSRRVRRALKAAGLATGGLSGQDLQSSSDPHHLLADGAGGALLLPLDDKPAAKARSRPMQIRLMPGSVDPRGRSPSPPEVADMLVTAARVAPLQRLEGLQPQLPLQLLRVPLVGAQQPQCRQQQQPEDTQMLEGSAGDVGAATAAAPDCGSGRSTRTNSTDGAASAGSDTSSGMAGLLLARSGGGLLGAYSSGPLPVAAAATTAPPVAPPAAAAAAPPHLQELLYRGYSSHQQQHPSTSSPSTEPMPLRRQHSDDRQPLQQHHALRQHTRTSQQLGPVVINWPSPSLAQQPQQPYRSDTHALLGERSPPPALLAAQLPGRASAPAATAAPQRSSPPVIALGRGVHGSMHAASADDRAYLQQQQQRNPRQEQEQQPWGHDSYGGHRRDLPAEHPQHFYMRSSSAGAMGDAAHPAQLQQQPLHHQPQAQRPLRHSESWHRQQQQPEIIDITMDDGPMPARPARHNFSAVDDSFGGHRTSAPGNVAAGYESRAYGGYQDGHYHGRAPSVPQPLRVAQQQPQGYARRPSPSQAPPHPSSACPLPQQQSWDPAARLLPEPAPEAWRHQERLLQPASTGRQLQHPQHQLPERHDLLQASRQASVAAAPVYGDRASLDGGYPSYGPGAAAVAAGPAAAEAPLPYRHSRATLVDPALPLGHGAYEQQHKRDHPQGQRYHPHRQQAPQQAVQQQPYRQLLQQQQLQAYEDDYAIADAAAAAVGTQDEDRFASAAQLTRLRQQEQREQHQQQRLQDRGAHGTEVHGTEVLRSIILKLAHEQSQQQRA
ncbi:hypothetical protein HXX76_008857 [Chlamydomonas incerta]|uniref:Myb-like domain-containing protein n=1 Tax=Chlamydomonas incerta TaxID=51695 RepID=A0A835SVY4_CHLIN|nr:hypothetical protein HXX76_008857 [Chlamydomonas incerta]|eukprot:KAG2432512.1 hypothetical protein HXX76_008857 [Chlamydomonas incerta]